MTNRKQDDADDIIDLDALDKPAGKVRLYGAVHPVLHIDGTGYRVVLQLQKDKAAGKFPDVDKMYEIVGRCVPSLDEEQVQKLNMTMVGAIIAIASNKVEDVARFAKGIAKNESAAKTPNPSRSLSRSDKRRRH